MMQLFAWPWPEHGLCAMVNRSPAELDVQPHPSSRPETGRFRMPRHDQLNVLRAAVTNTPAMAEIRPQGAVCTSIRAESE